MVIVKYLKNLVSPNVYSLINSKEFSSIDKIKSFNDEFSYHNNSYKISDEAKSFFLHNFGPKGHGIIEISELPDIFTLSRNKVTSLGLDMCCKDKKELVNLVNDNEFGFPG